MCPVATEQLSLFQAMGIWSDIRALKTNGTFYFCHSLYSGTPSVPLESVKKYPSTDFLLQVSKAILSFLNTLTYSSFPSTDKSHYWHQCQEFVNKPACRYSMYKFILLLFIQTASTTPSEHKKLVQYNSGYWSVAHTVTISFKIRLNFISNFLMIFLRREVDGRKTQRGQIILTLQLRFTGKNRCSYVI